MKVRSPVLGYNHNVRYADRLWHVQTEDSGVQNPHVFTHLFHDGTILATKRLDYDPASEVIAVQKLMQAQHKSMLRELKAGAFDEKISKYLGVAIVKADSKAAPEPDLTPEPVNAELSEPRPLAGPHEVFEEPPTDRTQQPQLDTDRNLGQPTAEPAAPTQQAKTPDTDRKLTVPPASRPNLTPLRPASPAQRPPLPPLRPPVRPSSPSNVRPVGSAIQPRQPAGIGGRRPSSGAVIAGGKPSAEGVVVARPAVIVGGNQGAPARPPGQSSRAQPGRSSGRWHPVNSPPQNAASASNRPPQATPVDKSAQDNIFGGDLISEKSLDEVILAYLSEDLNDK